MRLVILESPYAAPTCREIGENLTYARAALRDCLMRGEAPIASHLLYTQPGVLDDTKPDERTHGINAGLAWGRVAEASVFYVDRGVSSGMITGVNRAARDGRPIEVRSITDAFPVNLANMQRVIETTYAEARDKAGREPRKPFDGMRDPLPPDTVIRCAHPPGVVVRGSCRLCGEPAHVLPPRGL